MKPIPIKLTATDELTGEQIHVEFGMKIPDFEGMPRALQKYLKGFSVEQIRLFWLLLKFNTIYGTDNLIRRRDIDLKMLLEKKLITFEQKVTHSKGDDQMLQTEMNELIEKALLKRENRFIVPMSEEAYFEFREMILLEFEDIEKKFETMIESALDEEIKNLSLGKKLKYYFKVKKKIPELTKELKAQSFQTLIQKAKELDNELVKQGFHEEAISLVKDFDHMRYQLLLQRVIRYFEELDGGDSFHKQEFEVHGELSNLQWIIENTASRNDAFDLICMDAEEAYLDFLDWFCREEYKRYKDKMNKAERRAFQLLFFRRKAFYGRIPAFEPLFLNFISDIDKDVLGKLVLHLVLKKDRFGGYDLKGDVLNKWAGYLSVYPTLVDRDIDYFELLFNRDKCMAVAAEVCTREELEILSYCLKDEKSNEQPISNEILATKYRYTLEEMNELIQGIFRKIKSQCSKEGSIVNEVV
ncbi:hypothetical protein [Halalkalibacter alkaliphilus]|uniref:Uncharacterized protein n=1 Tax=Halalkalibacter alkaliphilus TaxID=2917993 RepID=A0A9X2I596_9BACI|nr:hypothetical protein [Halalkalibacter alkaliphilus]MCL7747039.1 hypothetical protein [Halalkalibacter alkaliphilus]